MNSKELKILKADSNDIQNLVKIGRDTFSETFLPHNRLETIENYLDKAINISVFGMELENPGSLFYLVFIDLALAGYLKLNFGSAQTETIHGNSMEIERIYLLKKYHGKNIGNQLMNYSISKAKEKEVDFIWLGVWEHNSRAINFYKKHGFKKFSEHTFMMGGKKQRDWLMKLEL